VPRDDEFEITIEADAGLLGGVYANFAMVNHSPFEFTLDFVRIDYARGGMDGVLVSRVNMSPAFVRNLIDTLEENWQRYAEKAAPSD
jgi:hypothetical protein